MTCLIINGMVFAQEMNTPQDAIVGPQDLIIGKWKNAKNLVYEFTADKILLVNKRKYAAFRFLEDVLVLTYLDSDADFEAGLKFQDDKRMSLTEYKDLGDKERTMLFKRLE